MNGKLKLLLGAAGLTVVVAVISAVAVARWIPVRVGPAPPAPAAPPAPKFQAQNPASSVPAAPKAQAQKPASAAARPQPHAVKRPVADEPPAYGLPLEIHLQAPEVPPEIRQPSPPFP